jgi:hypothetical protein
LRGSSEFEEVHQGFKIEKGGIGLLSNIKEIIAGSGPIPASYFKNR